MYYLYLHCCCQFCKVRYVSLSEAVYLNTVLRCCRLLCFKMCIYDFNWLYSLFCVILISSLHLKSYVLLSVLKWKLAHGGAFTHLSDAVNKVSVITVQRLCEIHSWKRCRLLWCWLGS